MRRPLSIFAFLLLTLPFDVPSRAIAASANPELQRLLNNDPDESKRLDAFFKLEALASIDSQQVIRSITDTSPQIRAAALRVGTTLATNDPELELRLIALSNDRSSQVRIQLLNSLPSFHHPKTTDLFLQVFEQEIDNPAAWPIALAAKKDTLWPFLTQLISGSSWTKESRNRIRFFEFTGNYIRESVAFTPLNALLTFAADDTKPTQRWIRLALLRGLFGRSPQPKNTPPLRPLALDSSSPALRSLLTTKDSEIRKILSAPGALLTWPEIP